MPDLKSRIAFWTQFNQLNSKTKRGILRICWYRNISLQFNPLCEIRSSICFCFVNKDSGLYLNKCVFFTDKSLIDFFLGWCYLWQQWSIKRCVTCLFIKTFYSRFWKQKNSSVIYILKKKLGSLSYEQVKIEFRYSNCDQTFNNLVLPILDIKHNIKKTH